MKKYNQKPETKIKKAEYMRKIRAKSNKVSSKKLVQLFLDLGFEDLAFEYAMERAPEMLVIAKVRSKPTNRK